MIGIRQNAMETSAAGSSIPIAPTSGVTVALLTAGDLAAPAGSNVLVDDPIVSSATTNTSDIQVTMPNVLVPDMQPTAQDASNTAQDSLKPVPETQEEPSGDTNRKRKRAVCDAGVYNIHQAFASEVHWSLARMSFDSGVTAITGEGISVCCTIASSFIVIASGFLVIASG